MPVSDQPPSLDQVLAGTNQVVEERQLEEGIVGVRLSALKAVALSYGTQAGFARRSYEIQQTVQKRSDELDEVYNFQGLILERNVLPPVLAEATNSLEATGSDTVRLTDHTYQIVSQARFVTTTPSWRDYLLQPISVQGPNGEFTLTPRDAKEKRYWDAQLKEGWADGVKQADQVFQAELARLDRDYKGMVLYRHLLSRRMVSTPFVAESNLGVTGDGNRIAVNDRILRITAMPQLDTQSDQWRAPIVPAKPDEPGKP